MIKLWQIIILTLPIVGMFLMYIFLPFPYGMIVFGIKIGYSIYIGEKYIDKYIKQKRENR